MKDYVVFKGDYIKCFNRDRYFEVVDIVDSMTVKLSNNRRIPATGDVIEDLKSAGEYEKFFNNFEV
jgi:hypothetical protein